MTRRTLAVLSILPFLALSCGSSHSRVKDLPVMRQPVKITEGGEMWERWSFSLLVEGPTIFALTGDERGIVLTRLRQDGLRRESGVILPVDDAWWEFPGESIRTRCGGDDVFEEGRRLVFEKKGIVRLGKDFLVAFGAESELSCKSSREETFTAANYFLAAFDEDWKPSAGPWKAKEEDEALAFLPVAAGDEAALFWLTESAIGVSTAPAGLEGEGKVASSAVKMKAAPEWGRCAAAASCEEGEGVRLAAAYAEEESFGGKHRVSVLSFSYPDPAGMTTARLKTELVPTAVEMAPAGGRIAVLWAVTGTAAPAGTISSILEAELSGDGTMGAAAALFEKKDMSGAPFLIKKLSCCIDGNDLAVGWVYDIRTMDGMEERIGLMTSTLDDIDDAEIYSYSVGLGCRGISSLCVARSGSQYLIMWGRKGIHQIRTAISSM
jgi:hypothetical protein